MAELSELRNRIDEIDAALVDLLEQRASTVLEVRKTKSSSNIDIYSPGRERAIVERVRELAADGDFPLPALEKIFRAIVSATRSLVGDLRVAYLGPQYSLTQGAALKQFGEDVGLLPLTSIEDVFRNVERGESNFGVVPAETGMHGLVTSTYKAFLNSSLCIVAEVDLGCRLAVVGNGSLSGITNVFSDTDHFVEASGWLRANLPEVSRTIVDNTAVALKRAKELDGSAAIVSEGLLDIADAQTLATGIEGSGGTSSRFFVIGSRAPVASGHDKTSLVLGVKDRAGALSDALQSFSSRGLTLTKIESRPMSDDTRDYVFFVDVLGHSDDAQVGEALNELSGPCSFVKMLGSYPVASTGVAAR